MYNYGQQQQQPFTNQGYQPQGQNPQYYPQQPMGSAPPPPQQQASYGAHYAESGMPKNEMGFSDASIRASFIRKVFLMVTVMLGVVAIMTAIPFVHQPTMQFVRTNPGVYFISYFIFLGVYIALMCCEGVRRSFPSNLICTAILTLSMGYMTMMIAARYNIEAVLLCLVITTVCCGSIILFSMQTKYDITSMMGYVFIASMVLMVFGFAAIIVGMFTQIRIIYTIYAALAALLFMVYLAIDIQMLMGGRKYELSPEEHIFAAIQLFMDIVMIFWYILMLFGGSKEQ